MGRKTFFCSILTASFMTLPAVAAEASRRSVGDAASSATVITVADHSAAVTLRRPMIEPGRGGGTEVAGAFVVVGLLLRAAYRNGLIRF